MSQPKGFRGTRNKKRSTKGRRLTPADRTELAKTCKHKRKRFRNRSTEAVCLDCGFVRTIKLDATFGIAVDKDWALSTDDEYTKPQPVDPEGTVWSYEIGIQLPGTEMEKTELVLKKSVVGNLLVLKDYVITHVLVHPLQVGTKLRIYHFLYEYQQTGLLPKPTWALLER